MAVIPVYIEAEEEISEIVERLKQHADPDVPIVVPPRSRLAQSRFNFQLLREYAGKLGKRVSIISTDAAVQAMAAEHGFQSYAGIDQFAPGAFVPAAAAAVGATPAPAATTFAPAPVVEAPRPPVAPVPRPAPRSRDADYVEHELAPLRGAPNRTLLYAGAAMVLIVGLVGFGLFVPSATVTLTAEAKPFTQSEDIQAAPGGGPVRVRVKDDRQQQSQQFGVTGTKIVPPQPATGQAQYTNNCSDPFFGQGLVVQNGTRLDGPDGQVFAQQGDVTVPAPNNGTPGTATGTIIGTSPGAKSNVGANTIQTIEGNPAPDCFTVTNPNPTGGGADQRKDPLMTQQDIDGARASLNGSLKKRIKEDLNKQAGSGEKLDDAVNYDPPSFLSDHHPGDVVKTFTATMTMSAEGAFYFDQDVKDQLAGFLKSKLPKGFVATKNGTNLQYSITQSQPGGHLTFHGIVSAFIGPDLHLDKIAGQLASRSTTSADSYLRTLPVKSHRVEQHPFPLPFLPLLSSKINVDYVVEQGGTTSG